MRSGRIRRRAEPLEATVARICREAGARVRENAFLKDMNVGVPASDERRIEVLASGLPCYNGAQLAIDVCLYSPLRGDGTARPRAHWQDGAALLDAIADKHATYAELVGGRRCRLVVLALEAGGRMSAETIAFVQQLAAARARSATASPGHGTGEEPFRVPASPLRQARPLRARGC